MFLSCCGVFLCCAFALCFVVVIVTWWICLVACALGLGLDGFMFVYFLLICYGFLLLLIAWGWSLGIWLVVTRNLLEV